MPEAQTQTYNEHPFMRKRFKNYFECESMNKFRNQNKIRQLLHESDLRIFCEKIGLKIIEIKFSPNENEDNDDYNKSTKLTFVPFNIKEQDYVYQWMIGKDLTDMSNRKYRLLRKLLKSIYFGRVPGVKKIIEQQKKLDDYFILHKNENEFGFFFEPSQKIKFVCEKFIERNSRNEEIIKNLGTTFNVKLSADSVTLSKKNIKILNFTFSLLNDKKNCMGIFHTYILGQFEIEKEDYENVKKSLYYLLIKLENLKSIEINGKEYQINYYFGADYYMLRLIYGLKASNASYGCQYCNVNLKEKPDPEAAWSIIRNLDDISNNHEPILKFINYDKCVLDILHLLLRVTDFLYEMLLNKLKKIDNNKSSNLEKRPNLKIFLNFLKQKCKLTNPSYVANEEIVLRNFNGNERLRIFQEMFKDRSKIERGTEAHTNYRKTMAGLFNQSSLRVPVNKRDHFDFRNEFYVWLKFYKIYKQLISDQDIPLEPMKKDLKKWLTSYLILNKTYRNMITISPYVHCFCFHLIELLETHKNINIFNTQGIEKLNHFCIKYYNFCTNKNNTSKKYITQLINKRNRIEMIKLNKYNTDEIIFSDDESENEDGSENEVTVYQ